MTQRDWSMHELVTIQKQDARKDRLKDMCHYWAREPWEKEVAQQEVRTRTRCRDMCRPDKQSRETKEERIRKAGSKTLESLEQTTTHQRYQSTSEGNDKLQRERARETKCIKMPSVFGRPASHLAYLCGMSSFWCVACGHSRRVASLYSVPRTCLLDDARCRYLQLLQLFWSLYNHR